MTASTAGLGRIAVEIAPGGRPLADPATYVWQNAGRRRTSTPIAIKAGRDDEAATTEPGALSLLMDDRDGNLSPRNAMGQWYGELTRGTPIRIVWPRTADDFVRPAVSGGWGTNSDGFSWSITGSAYLSTDGTRALSTLPASTAAINTLINSGSLDVDVVWSFTCPVMPTGAAMVTAAVLRQEATTTYVRAHVELQPTGDVIVKIVRSVNNAGTDLLSNTTVTTATAGTEIWGHARIDGGTILVKAWTGDREDEPEAWGGSATDNVLQGSGVGMFLWRLNNNASFTTYINNFEVTNILWSGNVPEWPPRWPDKSGNDSTTPITAAGVLRRLQQAGAVVSSPLRKQLGSLPYATGYLPLEDASGATYAGSGLPSGRPGSIREATPAGDDTLPGSDACMTLNTAVTSRVTMSTTGAATNGYSVLVLFKCPTEIPSERTLMAIRGTGAVARWEIYADGSVYGFRGYDESGTLIANDAALYSGVLPTDWVAMQLETESSGGTTTAVLLWSQVGNDDTFFISDSYSGTAPAVLNVTVQALVDGMAVAHLWAGDDALPFVDANFRAVANGHIGEQAGERIERLGSESGTPVLVLDGDSEPMGRQRSGAVLDLFRECEQADLGTLFERGSMLAYRPRIQRYAPPVAMALDWSLGDLAEPPEPQDDDQRLANYVEASRTGGSYAVAQDEDSIEADGVYDGSRELNIESDDRLPDFASWLLHLGTSDELRWPRINLDLVAHPELIPAWLGCTVGSRVTIANPPSQIAGQVIDLIIEGYSQQINNNQWTVELSCSPARPWIAGIYDSSTSLWQLRSTVTTDTYDESDTTIIVTTTENEPMSSTSEYSILIAGEEIGVPIGGAAARIGVPGAWLQTLSGLTRGLNGVNKPLPINSRVTIKNSGRWAV